VISKQNMNKNIH